MTFSEQFQHIAVNFPKVQRPKKSDKLVEQLKKQQNIFTKQSKTERVIKSSFNVKYNIAKENRAFVDSEFLKKCILDVVEIMNVENKKTLGILAYPGEQRLNNKQMEHELLEPMMDECR